MEYGPLGAEAMSGGARDREVSMSKHAVVESDDADR